MIVRTSRFRRAYTLVELTLAMSVGMAVAVMTLALVNQQIAFLRIFSAQNFLSDEAPIISLYVGRLVGKSERFRLHASVSDALAGTNARLTNSPVMVMNFRQPDGSVRASILAYEDRGTGPALYYYIVPLSGVLGEPQWAVTKKASNVSFFVDQGILRMQIDGPNGERVTYSGTMQL
jgi:hypothetical protein